MPAHTNQASKIVRLRTTARGRMIPVRAWLCPPLGGNGVRGWRVGLVFTLQAGPRFARGGSRAHLAPDLPAPADETGRIYESPEDCQPVPSDTRRRSVMENRRIVSPGRPGGSLRFAPTFHCHSRRYNLQTQ